MGNYELPCKRSAPVTDSLFQGPCSVTSRVGRQAVMQVSAGVFLYRSGAEGWEVLLVHPSGNYNRKAPWSIPKGIPDPGETLEQAARRECAEETGVSPGWLAPLGEAVYPNKRKKIVAFAGPAPAEAQPRCASWEVDRAEFVSIAGAHQKLHPAQCPLLDRLVDWLTEGRLPPSDFAS
jgi:predicted NUDIX family NTP pyrophosphohydrolase